jgi:hypothetical protein
MIISLFMEQTPLCRGEAGCGAHASVEHGRRQNGGQAREQHEQQRVEHKASGRELKNRCRARPAPGAFRTKAGGC